MTRILSAGDEFIHASSFVDAIRSATEKSAARSREITGLEFSQLDLPWPIEPFGPVEDVSEASGDVDQLIDALDKVDIAVTQMAPFTSRVFEARPDLKLIGVCRGGPVNIALDAATRAGVTVVNAPGRNAQAAAEYTVGLMLSAMRHIHTADAELKGGVWRGDYYTHTNAGFELNGATVGLIGLGSISRIVAKILRAFDAQVIAYDPYSPAVDDVEMVTLDDLLARSSVISLHARLTPETRNILNAERLRQIRDGAVLINTARGELMDYAPLAGMLESGKLGALALDVYDLEPPPSDWPLLSAPRVVLSPHLAGATRQTATRAVTIIASEVARFLGGQSCEHVVNPEVLT